VHISRWMLLAVLGTGAACTGQIGEMNVTAGDDRPSGGGGTGGGPGPGIPPFQDAGSPPTTTPDGGQVGIPPSPPPPTSDGGIAPPTSDGGIAPPTVGPSPLRQLGRTELRNTLRDLFPTLPPNFDANIELPADNEIQMAFALPGMVSDLEVKRFMDLSEAAIAALGTNGPANQFTCMGSDQTACARTFITTFGKRAFRRPLDVVEVDDLLALYTKLRTDTQMAYGFPDALGVVVEAIVQSPGFLYRWERGLGAPQMDGALVKFDNYEVASRLSYFIWNSMPDDALMAAADGGNLATLDAIAEQATRLLASPRADATLGDFITQWLELGTLGELIKDAANYPTFKPELRDSMRAETVAFARDVLRGSSPTFATLLTAPYTFVDAPLAQYYGMKPDGTGRVDLTGTARLGLLTQGALMAVKGNSYRTSPVRRGKFILNRMLCSVIPPPPPDVVPELPAPDPNKTVREQLAEHRMNPACAACHNVMDPLGLAFEYFDGAGNFRTDDRGHPIDSSGSTTLDANMPIQFRDARDLANAIASSPAAHECFVRQWLRYAIDRFEQDVDAAAVAALKASFETSRLDTRDLIVKITRMLPFTHRAPAQGEVLTP